MITGAQLFNKMVAIGEKSRNCVKLLFRQFGHLCDWPTRGGNTQSPYEILAAIGAGGMGEVYRAKDTKLDEFVVRETYLAIRLLHRHYVARCLRSSALCRGLN